MRNLATLLIPVALGLAAGACADTTPAETSTTTQQNHPGREVFLATDIRCDGCHTTLGSKAIGPTFLGLAGSEVELESGETVIADDEYLRRSIVDPKAQIVAGFNPVMPDFYAEIMTEQQINDVIDYIKTLSDDS